MQIWSIFLFDVKTAIYSINLQKKRLIKTKFGNDILLNIKINIVRVAQVLCTVGL